MADNRLTHGVKLSRYGFGCGGSSEVFDIVDSKLWAHLRNTLLGSYFDADTKFAFCYYENGPLITHGVPGIRSLKYFRQDHRFEANIVIDAKVLDMNASQIAEFLVLLLKEVFDKIVARIQSSKLPADIDCLQRDIDLGFAAFLKDSSDLSVSPAWGEIHKRLRNYLNSQRFAHALGTALPRLDVGDGYELIPDPEDEERVIWRRV